jgi:tetratricopeptide (TPR) repeat protein/predicted MPP superfamily phosphohydrolase
MAKEHALSPDLIFFTGDAAFGYSPDTKIDFEAQFDTAHVFLEKVRSTFPAVKRENVFIVPGNHDVDRRRVMEPATRFLDAQRDFHDVAAILDKQGDVWDTYVRRLSAYRDFLGKNGYAHLNPSDPWLTYAATRQIAGAKVGITGFNSAWSSCRDGEKGKLWLAGEWQFSHVADELENVDLSILLMHHPTSWLVEAEEPDYTRFIEMRFDFYLHGHEHRDWVTQQESGHVRVAAGACYDRSDRENGYNFVRLNLLTREGEVWLRKYDRTTDCWMQRIVPGRTTPLGMWPLSPRVRGSVPVVQRDLQAAVSQTQAKNVDADVQPSPSVVPDYPIRAVFQANPPLGRDAERDQVANLLRDTRIVLLHGAPGQGKTALARYIALSLKDSYPDGVYEVDLQNERQLDNISKHIGVVLGDTETGNPLKLLDSRRALIILDSFELVWRTNREEPVRRFLNLLIDSLAGGSRIIITSQDRFEKEGVVPKQVGRLEKQAAVALFHDNSQGFYLHEEEAKIADFVMGKLDGHPLTIIVVARFGSQAAGIDLDALSRLWQEKFMAIAEYRPPLDDKRLTTSFELSYASLDREQQRLFLAMSLLPDGLWGTHVRSIWGDDELLVYHTLSALVGRSLLEGEKGLWKTLGPIFLYAQNKRRAIESTSSDLHSALQRDAAAIDHFYDRFIEDHAPQATDSDPRGKNNLIRQHFHNIHVSFDRRIEPSTKPATRAAADSVLRLYWAYHNNLSGYQNAISSPEDAVYYLDKAAAVFQVNDDNSRAMECRYYMGNILWLRGDLDRARPLLTEVSQSEWSAPPLKDECKRAFAHFEYTTGNIANAVALYEELLVHEETSADDAEFRLRVQIGLLDAYRKLENYEQAQVCFRQMMQEMSDQRPGTRGNILRGYAYVLLARGDIFEAEKLYLEALEIFKNVSAFGQAHCRRGLGDVYVAMKRFPDAENEFDYAMKLYDEARKNPSLGVGLVELGRGRLRLGQGNVIDALDHFRSAISLFKNLSQPFEEAKAYELSGDALSKGLMLEDALGNYQLALKLYRHTGCDAPALRVQKAIVRVQAAI